MEQLVDEIDKRLCNYFSTMPECPFHKSVKRFRCHNPLLKNE